MTKRSTDRQSNIHRVDIPSSESSLVQRHLWNTILPLVLQTAHNNDNKQQQREWSSLDPVIRMHRVYSGGSKAISTTTQKQESDDMMDQKEHAVHPI